jgi:hypothetical protein
VSDFDLRGPVEHCKVKTHYGREEYFFDPEGRLVKSITQYNDTDYDTTHYKFEQGFLTEKRDEQYRDGQFQQQTSIAHFYSLDTTANRLITEKVVSYAKEFLHQNEYSYNDQQQLESIQQVGNTGIDKTSLAYESYKDERTVSYLHNGTLERSQRVSYKKQKGKQIRIELDKTYLEGMPAKAEERKYGENGVLLEKTEFEYDQAEGQFVPQRKYGYSYNENQDVAAETLERGKQQSKKEYIYQYDSSAYVNWVKQIVTPDNTYTTRKITYYTPEAETEGDKKE